MLEMGQPLHAFDYDLLQCIMASLSAALNREKLQTQDNVEGS
jgi:phenylalanyl-tRNA synthetase beta subunit